MPVSTARMSFETSSRALSAFPRVVLSPAVSVAASLRIWSTFWRLSLSVAVKLSMLSKLRLMRVASTARTSAPMSVSVASSLSALSLRRPGGGAPPRRAVATVSPVFGDAPRVRNVLPVLRQRLGEALDVFDRARDPLRLDRAHELLDVVGERLELCGERPDALRRLPDLLEEAVDAGRVVAQRQREALDIGEGAVERAFVVGDDLADALEHVVGPAGDRA